MVVSRQFSLDYARLSHSWSWIHEDFASDYRALTSLPEIPGKIIWDTVQKYVKRTQSPSCLVVAYKAYRSMQPGRYFWRLSPLANEAENYQRFLLMGLPMAKVLGVGETRRCFMISTGFLITEFIGDARDGGCFLAKGELASETALRDELICRNMRYLATLHDAGFLHRGLTPFNFLWRKRPAPDADGNLCDLIWIDVATCHRMPRFLLKKYLVKDFVKFFHFYSFTSDERRRYLDAYYGAVKKPFFSEDELCAKLDAALAAHKARHHRR